MRLVLGTIFKKAEQMLGFFYVCPLEDQGPLALRASMRSRASWRILVLVALRASVRSRASWRVHAPVPLRRSEEHTSELQSRGHLVCRLLLEKKNNNRAQQST